MSRGRPQLVTVALLLAVSVAGCTETGSGAQEPGIEPGAVGVTQGYVGPLTTLVTDNRSDAYEYNSYWLAGAQPCVFVNPPVQPPAPPPLPPPAPPLEPLPTGACGTLFGTPVTGEEPTGAAPASPARDILEARMQETPTTLEVFLEVAELQQDFAGAAEGGYPGQGTVYGVSWLDAMSGCLASAVVYVMPLLNGLVLDSYVYTDCSFVFAAGETPQGPCTFTYCWWKPQFDVAFGAPATLHWSVSRQDLAASGAGLSVVEPFAFALNFPTQSEASPNYHASGLVQMEFFRSPDSQYYLIDMTHVGTNFTFEAAAEPTLVPALPVHVKSAIVHMPGPQAVRPDLHFVGIDFEDLGDRFRFTVELDLVEETPRDHGLSVDFGIPGYYAWFGYVASQGVRTPFATLASPDSSEVSIPATLRIEAGAPGHLIFEVLRADLPAISGQYPLTGIWAASMLNTYNATAVGDTGIATSSWQAADVVQSGPSVHLRESSTEFVPQQGRFTDPLYDVQPPQDLLVAPTKGFDLTGFELLSTRPGELRISLGVRDLTNLRDSVAGYDGVFYALGVATETGTTMVGYYRGTEKPAGTFLCAPDTAVLEEVPVDPQSASDWTEIVGRVLSGANGGKNQEGQAGNSAFIMVAPAECFGLEPDASVLNITAVEAKAFLIRRAPAGAQGGTSMPILDEAEGRPFTLSFATIQEPPPSFWDAPFGLEQFWNIFGAALAVLTVFGTFIVFLRRRRVMKGYIADIAKLEKLHVGEPVARAAALVALRRRLHRDIVSHRVSDSSYILDRLRSSITSARLVTLGESFYDLPTALALRIERLLDDGRLTTEEESMLEPMVGRSAMPKPDRQRLIQRLQRWVAEDAGTDA